MNAENRPFGLTSEQRTALHIALVWTKKYFDSVPQGTHIGGHGFDKTMRKAGMAAIIDSGEGQPVFLPVLASMIMDVGRATSDPRSKTYQHGELSRELSEKDLFPKLTILRTDERILLSNALEDHSKMNNKVRRSYVVEVAMDADRLDCLGALGPLRAASWRPNIPIILPEETSAFSGDTQIQTMYQDMSVRHMEWVDMLWTKTARNIATPRIKAYRKYLERLKTETAFTYQAFLYMDI